VWGEEGFAMNLRGTFFKPRLQVAGGGCGRVWAWSAGAGNEHSHI